VWVKDLATGKASAITQAPSFRNSPIFVPDGSKVAYDATENACYVVSANGGTPQKLPDDCNALFDWSADGSKILYGQGRRIGVWDLNSGQKSELLAHSQYDLNRSHLSPDNRWVVFRATIDSNRGRTLVAPVRWGGPPVPESEWIRIHEGTGNDRPAAAW